MYHAKFWPSCLFETWKQNNNIYCWHLDIFPNESVLTVYLKQHLSLPADQDTGTASPVIRYSQTAKKVSALGDPQVQRVFCLYFCQLLPSSGSQCAQGWLRGRKLTHLLPGFSWSRSLRTDLPSMSGGESSPAMSRMVGARSMFRTICGTLQRDRWSRPRPSTSGWAVFSIPGLPGLHCFSASPLVPKGWWLHLGGAWVVSNQGQEKDELAVTVLERRLHPWTLATLTDKLWPDIWFL